jgi:hypothetical protein
MTIRCDAVRAWRSADRQRRVFTVASAIIACASSGVAHAQVATRLSIATDDRFRGFSLADGRPVAAAAVSWDSPYGIYADAQAIAVSSARQGLVC